METIEPLDPDWITVSEAAAILGIVPYAVQYRLRKGDLIPAHPPAGERSRGRDLYLSRRECEAIGFRWHRDEKAPQPRRPEPITDPDLLTVKEAAALIGLSPAGFRYWIKVAGLEPVREPFATSNCGYRLRFRRSEVEAVRSDYLPVSPLEGRNPSPVECAYLAGLIDGEGSIVIVRKENSVSFTVRLHIYNNDLELLQWVAETFARGLLHVRRKRERWAQSYLWACSAGTAQHVLKLVRPYLHSKSAQADIAIEFQDHQQTYHEGRGRRVPLEELAWRIEQKARLSAINRRNGIR